MKIESTLEYLASIGISHRIETPIEARISEKVLMDMQAFVKTFEIQKYDSTTRKLLCDALEDLAQDAAGRAKEFRMD